MSHETTVCVVFPTGDEGRYIVTCRCGWQTDTHASGRAADAAEKRHREADHAAPQTPGSLR